MMYWAAKKDATTIFGRLIKLWTYLRKPKHLPSYCHIELVFSNGDWFSAREFKGGVGFSTGIPPGEKRVSYDFFALPTTPEKEAEIRKWCEAEVGCDYDVRGILFRFLPIPVGWQHPEKWFCSEICVNAMQNDGFFKGFGAADLDPNKATRIILGELLQRRLEQ